MRRAPEQGLKAFLVEATAGWRPALTRWESWTSRRAEGGRADGRTGPRLRAGCGRALRVRWGRESTRAPTASPPRPASSPYHVATPHVEEVSVHHSAVAASLLGHAKQLRGLHRAVAGRTRSARCNLCPQTGLSSFPAPPRTNGTRRGSRLVGRQHQCVCAVPQRPRKLSQGRPCQLGVPRV